MLFFVANSLNGEAIAQLLRRMNALALA